MARHVTILEHGGGQDDHHRHVRTRALPVIDVVRSAVPSAVPTAPNSVSAPATVLSPLPSGPAPLGLVPSPVRRRRRRRTRWPIPVLAVLSMTIGLVLQLGHGAPSLTVSLAQQHAVTVGGSVPALPWPSAGQAALAVPAAGVLVSPGPETTTPVASLTKMMTALVVLRDHPLKASASGPQIVMTTADQQDAAADSANNDTSIPVTAGESLSERQLLDGLLVHSANDFADALATWDAGSVPAFVVKMNTTALWLGMTQTQYVDPNGINPGDVSTPVDQLKLAQAAMTIPAFAAVVAQPSITEPMAGLLSNYVSAIGTDGVVGIKSGFTQAAMGCVVLAADRQVDGRRVLILAAVTGQPGVTPLDTAQSGALSLIDTAAGGLQVATLVPAHRLEGSLSAPWSTTRPRLVSGSTLSTLVWPGTRWSSSLQVNRITRSVTAGQVVGSLTFSSGKREISVPVRTTASVRPPSMSWRLIHS
ncbi:MAG TPA: hypothetical protein VK428_04690 [Acidimicrobiales bacterium]|nr:hypothetical protein [Acidimicrobiales bacterium]